MFGVERSGIEELRGRDFLRGSLKFAETVP